MKQTIICIILLLIQAKTFCQNSDSITKLFYPPGLVKKKIEKEKITYADSLVSSIDYGFSIDLQTKKEFNGWGYVNGCIFSVDNNVGSLQFWLQDYGSKYNFSREMVNQVMKSPEVFLEEMRNSVKKSGYTISSDHIKAVTVGGLPAFQYVCDIIGKDLYGQPLSSRIIKTEVFYKSYHFYTFCIFNIEESTYVNEWQGLNEFWISQIHFNE